MELLTQEQFKKRIKEIYSEEKKRLISKKIVKESFQDKLLDQVQTVLDFLGWIDPTPIADTINGFIYWSRGDRLFAFLTWISAFPYLGDLVAKPTLIALKQLKNATKIGGSGSDIIGVSNNVVKQIENALDAGDIKEFTRLVDESGGVMQDIVKNFDNSTFLGSVIESLGKVKTVAKRIPIIGGLVSTVDEWTMIFTKASKEIKTSKDISLYYTKALKMGVKPLNDIEKKLLTQEINELNRFRGFSNYEMSNPDWWGRYYDGAIFKLYGNRDMRGLIGRTKWYLGLLDWLNLGNYVGPNELEREVSGLKDKMEAYDQTDVAKELVKEDLSDDSGMFDKITKFIPQSFAADSKMKDATDPLNILFSMIGL